MKEGYVMKDGKRIKIQASSTIGLKEMVISAGYVKSRSAQDYVDTFDSFTHFHAEIAD